MNNHKEKIIKNNIFLSHHDENHPFFERHVFIIGGYAVCIGCLAELFAMINVMILFIFPNILDFTNNIIFFLIIVILSPLLNFYVYIYRFIKKDEFPNKYIRFLGRYLLTLGLLYCMYAMIIYQYLITGLILIVILGTIFLLLRKYSNEYLMKFYDRDLPLKKDNQ